MTWPVGQARYFSRVKVRDAEGEHVGDDFAEVPAGWRGGAYDRGVAAHPHTALTAAEHATCKKM